MILYNIAMDMCCMVGITLVFLLNEMLHKPYTSSMFVNVVWPVLNDTMNYNRLGIPHAPYQSMDEITHVSATILM